MSFLTEVTARRMATLTRTAASSTFTTVPRASFTTSLYLRKTVTEAAKDTLKTVDRAVSDKLVDGIDAGVTAKEKVKGATSEVTGKTSGEASELSGEAKGKAQELKGQAKGKASELKGKAKEKVNEL
ncbi:hypothetical protein BD289DRAFT_453184 [Coniella lustricola]|uniref:LEA domain protein n=1 Tax=Coniella lustricola TaxID=2025994 RepID=A0A2T3A8C0_9PEZI|nr:hypothetical protein BD289DRAFT_453184 [Coniella lustricola]